MEAPVCWSGADGQDWDKIGQSEDGEMSATVLREEQRKALIAQFCSQSFSPHLSEDTVEAEDRDRDVGCFGGLYSGDEDMHCINATSP